MGLESTARYRNVTAQNGVFSRVGGDTRGMYSVQRKATHTLPVMLRGRTRTTRSTLQVWQIYRLRQLRGGLQTAAPHWPGHIPPGTCSHAALPRASASSRHCSTPPPTVPSPWSAQLPRLCFSSLFSRCWAVSCCLSRQSRFYMVSIYEFQNTASPYPALTRTRPGCSQLRTRPMNVSIKL